MTMSATCFRSFASCPFRLSDSCPATPRKGCAIQPSVSAACFQPAPPHTRMGNARHSNGHRPLPPSAFRFGLPLRFCHWAQPSLLEVSTYLRIPPLLPGSPYQRDYVCQLRVCLSIRNYVNSCKCDLSPAENVGWSRHAYVHFSNPTACLRPSPFIQHLQRHATRGRHSSQA